MPKPHGTGMPSAHAGATNANTVKITAAKTQARLAAHDSFDKVSTTNSGFLFEESGQNASV